MEQRDDAAIRVYAVLGHPVHHSLSPPMQNAAFRAAGKRAEYVALDVTPEHLADALRGLHAAGVAGLNLTAPHKEAAWGYLCGATKEAEACRAVNTLRRETEGWFGHATDGLGFAAWVASLGVVVRGARVLLLGAGGAARSITPVIASLGSGAIGIVSRDGGRARSVADAARGAVGPSIEIVDAALDDSKRAASLPPWDLLVRALASSTLHPGEEAWWRRLSKGAPALELNYGDRAAGSRAKAAAEGRRFEDGLGLLLHQGALSYEFWLDERAPLDAMRTALAKAVG